MKAKSHLDVSFSIYVNDEPVAIRIIPSGWSKPQTFHTIIEYGDYEDSNYIGLLTIEQIKEKYDFDIESSICLSKISKDTPNDGDLGRKIRSICNEYNKEANI